MLILLVQESHNYLFQKFLEFSVNKNSEGSFKEQIVGYHHLELSFPFCYFKTFYLP